MPGRPLRANRRTAVARAFGERLRSLRTAAELSEGELVARCELSRPMLAKIEVGSTEARLSLILTLCDGLDVSPDELMAGLLAASSASGTVEARIQAKLASLTPRETEVSTGAHL